MNGGYKMIGNPKYSKSQKVKFKLNGTEEIIGEIYIIDAYGTFGQNEEVSYDIMCKDNNTLYKHIRESDVFPV